MLAHEPQLHFVAPQDLADGIRRAHSLGLKVFIDPLLTVMAGGGSWGGFVRFSDQQEAATWFTSYWQAYEPYILVAAANNAGSTATRQASRSGDVRLICGRCPGAASPNRNARPRV